MYNVKTSLDISNFLLIDHVIMPFDLNLLHSAKAGEYIYIYKTLHSRQYHLHRF